MTTERAPRHQPSIGSRGTARIATPTAHRKRRHAAARARIIVAGLSISATVGLVAVMDATPSTEPLVATAQTLKPTGVVARDASDGSTSVRAPVASAPPVSATDAAPVTSSQTS